MEYFKALWTEENEDGSFNTSLQVLSTEILASQEVLVQVLYSSLNYKDALSANGHRGITQHFPHIPGIDAAGIVLHDATGQFQSGDQVIITGFDLGMNTHGGLAELISVPASWIVKLRMQVSLKKSMQIGTAGLTAGMAVRALQQNQIFPSSGEILVTGASGGVGMCAIKLLNHLGYQVVALTGKPEMADALLKIGATRVIDRLEFISDDFCWGYRYGRRRGTRKIDQKFTICRFGGCLWDGWRSGFAFTGVSLYLTRRSGFRYLFSRFAFGEKARNLEFICR